MCACCNVRMQAEMHSLSRYMHQRRLPRDLYDAVLLQRHHRWRQARVLNERKLLQLLSPALRMDLAVLTRRSVLLKCPAVVLGVNELTQRYLCPQLEQQVCDCHLCLLLVQLVLK
jgi:hypothetical protein